MRFLVPHCTCLTAYALAVQFTKAVEAKQVAQQDAERARFVVLKADQVRIHACCLRGSEPLGLFTSSERAHPRLMISCAL